MPPFRRTTRTNRRSIGVLAIVTVLLIVSVCFMLGWNIMYAMRIIVLQELQQVQQQQLQQQRLQRQQGTLLETLGHVSPTTAIATIRGNFSLLHTKGFHSSNANSQYHGNLTNVTTTAASEAKHATHATKRMPAIVSSSSSSSSSSSAKKYAYAFVIGGVHEDRPAYRGFLWTVFISVNILKKLNTCADFWLFVRLSPDSKLDHLPLEERRILAEMGVHVVLQPKPRAESFAQIVFDKFLTWNMTEYKRVMFLDADMIPLTNLDYYFCLSDPDCAELPTELKPNFIIATQGEPCNTGMFMVEPSREAFEQYKEVMARQSEKTKNLPYPYFDYKDGWGHNFRKYGDYWESLKRKSSKWKFHASHSDQGLMFYFAKYVRKDVSIAIGDRIQNWKSKSGELPELESEKIGVLAKYQGELLRYQWSCDKPREEARVSDVQYFWWRCRPPYDSTAHFMGSSKPWKGTYDSRDYTDYTFRQTAARYLWFKELTELNEKHNMGLDLKHWDKKYLPAMQSELLGQMAKFDVLKNLIG